MQFPNEQPPTEPRDWRLLLAIVLAMIGAGLLALMEPSPFTTFIP